MPKNVLAFLGLLFATSATQAAVFQTLSTPSWINYWPGFNQLAEFGAGDDIFFDPALQTHPANALPGQPLNPNGWTGSFYFFDGAAPLGVSDDGLLMGYFNGTTTIPGQLQFGSNTISDVSSVFEQNVFDPYANGADIDDPAFFSDTVPIVLNAGPFALELAPGFSHTSTVAAGNVINNDYYYRLVGVTTLAYRAQTFGLYVLPGQDPAALFPGNPAAVAAFNASIAILNADPATQAWTFLGLETAIFWAVDPLTGGPLAGFENVGGLSSQGYFSLDATAAPVPLPAGLPLLLGGLATLGGLRSRRRLRTCG